MRKLADAAAREAIVSRLDVNVLVEAGAGSGKTYSLARRMAAGIVSGRYDVRHMAAVTFTRKAAAELRGRFQLALEEVRAGLLADPAAADRLARVDVALGSLEQFFSGTIHAFCAHLLRERPVEAGIAPGFSELDGEDDEIQRKRAWRDFLARERGRGSPALAALEEAGLAPQHLDHAFERICTFEEVTFPAAAGTRPDPAAAWTVLDRFCADLKRLLPATIDPKTTCRLQETGPRLLREVRWADRASLGGVASILLRWEGDPGIILKWWQGNGYAARDAVAALQNDIAPFMAQYRQYVYGLAVALLTEARLFARDGRRRASVLNYGDLLMAASALLRERPDVRRALQRKYRWLFVDEFQDTDPIQAEVILALAGDDEARLRPGSLFVVGDPKQSIYRFRRADIDVYNAVRDRIREDGGLVLSLTTSFRATPPLCAWANEAFATLLPATATQWQPAFQPLDPAERTLVAGGLQPSRSGSGTAVEGTVVAGGLQPSRPVVTLTTSAAVKQGQVYRSDAAAIARYIQAEIKARRRVPEDFLVLARTRKHLGEYSAALEAAGVPVEVTGAGAFGHSALVGTLQVLLAALSDPDDQVALVAVLCGPLFGITDADLFAWKQAGGSFTLTAPLEPASRSGRASALPTRADDTRSGRASALPITVHSALSHLHSFYRLTRTLPAPAAVERILEESGFLAYARTVAPDGADAGDLWHAVDRIRRVTESGGSLADACDALEQDTDSTDVEAVPLEAGRRGVVRVMNLHKAKGLEAPVVFLADPCAGLKDGIDVRIVRGTRSGRASALPDDARSGRASALPTPAASAATGYLLVTRPNGEHSRFVIGAPADWDAHEAAERQYADAEAMRLLYVAATRPKSLLVVSRWEKWVGKGRSRWGVLDPFLASAPELPVSAAVAPPTDAATDLGADARASAATARAAAHAVLLAPSFESTSVTALVHGREDRPSATDPRSGRPSALPTANAVSSAQPSDPPGSLVSCLHHRTRAEALAWGTFVHALLEHALRHGDTSRARLGRLARWLARDDAGLAAGVGETLDLLKRNVFASDVWQRAMASQDRQVEVPFARREALPDGTTRVLHGAIDLVFRTSEGWEIVDWKTDKHPPADSHYAEQLAYYADTWAAAVNGAVIRTTLTRVRTEADDDVAVR